MVRREPLNRDKILDAALALASEHGLDGLSMRRLAKELGVEAMSLYNHVANKADILDGMAERVYGEVERPDRTLPWPEQVRAVALSVHRVMGRNPVVPLALVTDQANPTSVRALQAMDDLVAALAAAGFADADIRVALGAVNSLVFGSLLLSTGGFSPSHDHRSVQNAVYRHQIDTDRLPHFGRMLPVILDSDPEHDFARALDLLISGLVAASPRQHP